MKLLIAIPAFNEEDSIAQTIGRTLAARDRLLDESPVSAVDITVVSDGSTDRTVERCRPYVDRITLVAFEHNRGYGAAIKHAWEQSDADLLSFLDADGTCDPEFFVDLCRAIERDKADIAVGSRLHSSSKIPRLRRAGNRFFASLLSTLASKPILDAASGMRVVRASSLPRILPLPDGLHFTPAMTARVALSSDLKLVELDMPYRERLGQSKLRVVGDGLRFLRVIIETALTHKPSRLLMTAGALLLAVAAFLTLEPLYFYIAERRILEWMIYRFIVTELLTFTGVLLIGTGYLVGRVASMILAQRRSGIVDRVVGTVLRSRRFWLIPFALVTIGGALVFPSFLQLIRTGVTYEHWSRFIVMSSLVGVALILSVVRVLEFVLDLLDARLAYLRQQGDGSRQSTASAPSYERAQSHLRP